MATSVLSNSSSQFSTGAEAYSSTMYSNFPSRSSSTDGHGLYLTPDTDYESFPAEGQPSYMYNTDSAPMSYSSTDSWANQANALRRVSSRSPSIQHDRTPIRHHKPNITRSRSTSKSEALLAYATEQSVQSAQHSTSTTPSLPQTTPSSSPGLFHPQSYTSPSMATSYSQHAAYYDNQSPHFHDMHSTSSNQSHAMSEYITANRAEMQIPSMLGTGLSAHETMYLQGQSQSRNAALSGLPPTPLGFPPLTRPLESTPGAIEVSSSRNKPQCWEHGCNGRQFSTFSNLLRHQREKSGTAAKAKCPHCGTEFTRTTARNGHMYGGKCKGMPDSGRRSPSAGDGQSDTEGQR